MTQTATRRLLSLKPRLQHGLRGRESMRLVTLFLAAGLFGLSGCSILDFDSGGRTMTVSSSGGGSFNGTNQPVSVSNAGGSSSVDSNALDGILFASLNTFRSSQGRNALNRSPLLDAAAQDLADVMARKNNLSHSADGQRAGDRIEDAGYVTCNNGQPWAENIARSSIFGTTNDLADVFMTGWENSPGHRKNMVGLFADVGIAVAETRDGERMYAVQVFGTPGPGRCLQ